MILTRVCFLVALTFMNITLENTDAATLVDLLNDVKNKLAELQAGEVKLQKEIEDLAKNGINATGIEEEVHDVDQTVEEILHHVGGSDGGTTMTTRPTTREMLMANSGTPGASSSHHKYPLKNAFAGTSAQWLNVEGQFPALIWMRFSKPHRLAKIGFMSPYLRHSPRNLGFIGSDDCSHWTYLLNIAEAGFTKDWQSKTWVIPSENRHPFHCIGVSWPNRGKGDGFARISNITMWEEL